MALFILGSGVAGGATSTAVLIFGRSVQGLGGGGITIIGQLIISDLVSPREVPKYVGYLFGSLILGTSIGPFLGGTIVKHISWRWVRLLIPQTICKQNIISQKSKGLLDQSPHRWSDYCHDVLPLASRIFG